MKLLKSILLLALASLSPMASYAQSLTADQEAKLNSLPPALRAQAMDELGKLRGNSASQQASAPVEQPVVVKPKAESADKRIENEFESATDLATTAEQPKAKIVGRDLKQFGYDLFAGSPTTFAPATEIPVPVDYVLGPGDQVRIQLFGKESSSYELYVSRDGILQVPELGPLSVAGQTFNELKADIARRVADQMIGIEVFVSLGELRSMRIFMLGEVNRPGAFTVSSLSTMTNALFVSGGIRPIGTLRNIQLKRAGEIVTTLDLYDLLLRGDTSTDARLQPGDVIFVPPVGTLVGIAGETRRPAIYELKGEESASSLIEIAGGLTPQAFPSISQVERISESGMKEVLDLDLTQVTDKAFKVRNGDVLRIYSTLDRTENAVWLSGQVERPGSYQWFPGMKLTDVISDTNALLPAADLNYVLIERENKGSGQITALSSNLQNALNSSFSPDNLTLEAKDKIFVLNNATAGTRTEIQSTLQKLRNQATFTDQEKIVSVRGSVRHPGEYPLEPDMRVSDLIRASGFFTPNAYTLYSIVERQDLTSGRISIFSVDLQKVLQDPSSEFNNILQSQDKFYVLDDDSTQYRTHIEGIIGKLRSQATSEEPEQIVRISGAVRHPGEYPLESKMTAAQLIKAAGGYSQSAYTLEAELVRYTDNNKELRQSLILPINLRSFNTSKISNIELQPFDSLTIRKMPEWSEKQTITIQGEVRFPGTYNIERGETISHVIQRAGGLTSLAHPASSRFFRAELRKSEEEQLRILRERLKEDISAAKLQEQRISSDSVSTAEILLNQLETTEAVGRLVIDLPKILSPDHNSDVRIMDGDLLLIPQRPESVTVIGSVNYPTSHFYEQGVSMDEYINMSGGLMKRADKRQIYVVRANGQVVAQSRSRFFPLGGQTIYPGDTIVVPVDVDRMRPLQYWGQVSQIIYQIALGAAAVNSF